MSENTMPQETEPNREVERSLEFAKSLATKAGTIMATNFELGMDKEWKEDETPLTITDTTINELVINAVREQFPEHGVLGEEASFDTDKEYLWVVDPVDGTMPFSHGIPASVFSLALVRNGVPQVAVVNDPFSERLYSAAKGRGAFVNGQKLQVNEQADFGAQVFIDVAARFQFKGFDAVKILGKLAEKQVRATKSFTAVFNALPVVTGQHAASIVLLEYPWDGAAISLITTEAGGKVTDLHGNERVWNKDGDGFIVSNGVIHQGVLDILRETT